MDKYKASAGEVSKAQSAYMDKLFAEYTEEGDRTEYKTNSKFAEGKQTNYRVAEGIESFSCSYFLKEHACSNIMAFPREVIVIYKVSSGRLLFDTGDDRRIILKQGDIINFAGNSPVQRIQGFGEIVSLVGVVCYYGKMLDSLKALGWDTSSAEGFFNDKTVRNALVYRGNIRLDEILFQLAAAIEEDNRFLIHAKTFEALYHGIADYKGYINSNRRGYSSYHIEKVEKIKAFLDDNIESYYSMPFLAEKFGIGLSRLQSIFKESYGVSPYQYHLGVRLAKSKELLQGTSISIMDIAMGLGFKSSSKFSESFKRAFGYLPSSLRK